MKKIILFLLFITYPIQFIWASFLDNSSTYIKLSSSITSEQYINKKSTKVLRYDPPFYIIQGNFILNDFDEDFIYCGTYNFYYDIEKQEMKAKLISTSVYDKAGNLIKSEKVSHPFIETVNWDTSLWHFGNAYFFCAYNRFFDPFLNYKYDIKT